MNVYAASVSQMKKMLGNLDKWIDTAVEHGNKKSFDPEVLLGLRLIPDQYPLLRQVQAACDAAKAAGARLAGKEPPRHPDTEKTLEEVKKRIHTVVSYLDTLTEKDFEGAESRKVLLPFLEGKHMLGAEYLVEMAQPNFYFHVTTAYAILRKNGVELGKRDFIGSLTLHG
jgi:hypothetical protein